MEAQLISPKFNQEVIWGSKKSLFDIYFKDEIFRKRYKYALVEMNHKLTFEDGLKLLSR